MRWTALALLLGACASAPPPPERPQQGVAIYLVAHEKHSGIVVRRADIPAGIWPESRDFPRADYLEVGWGDRGYYYGREQGMLASLRSAFWPGNPSVLHV